jgi:hypothetical protein
LILEQIISDQMIPSGQSLLWRDQAALDAHFRTPHLALWREAWPAFGVSDRRLTLYEVAGERPL